MPTTRTEPTGHRLRQRCFRPRASHPLAILWIGLCAAALAPTADAHDQSYPIEADRVLLETLEESSRFEFDSSDAFGLPFPSNPVIAGSALLVRGEGENALRTPLIQLDQTKWSAPSAGSFTYASDDPDRPGGVTSIILSGDALEIRASGDQWSFDPDGPLDAVSVHFRVEEEWYCTRFDDQSATVLNNAAGLFEAMDASAPPLGACDEPVCGNGEHEIGEECDDGNLVDGDGCDTDCRIGACDAESFESTFEGIRKVIFEEPAYGCAQCHGSVNPFGDLTLVPDPGSSDPNAEIYENLLGTDGLGIDSLANPSLKLVEISEPALSVLYLKLWKKRLEGLDPGYEGPEVGSAMPAAGQKLSEAHTEAVRRWIRAGAPRDLVVEGTAELLGTCLPPPEPLKVTPPEPPPAAAGFQLQQTPWELDGLSPGSNGEDEICMVTYYDLSELAPDEAIVRCPAAFRHKLRCSNDSKLKCKEDADCADGGTCEATKNTVNDVNRCVTFNRQKLIQDAQSHHSIIDSYTGVADTSDPAWGEWTYKLEPTDPEYEAKNGTPCDPVDVDHTLGFNPGCSSAVVQSVACTGYGPPDMGTFSIVGGSNQVPLSGSQEPYYEQDYEDGVYSYVPVKGIVIWNSHAFNLTQFDTTMAQYLNLEYAIGDEERQYEAEQIFEADWIFAQYIQPFETQEICATKTLKQHANLFQLNSHTHVFGTRFRIWGPPNEPCQAACPKSSETGDPTSDILSLPIVGLCDDEEGIPYCTGPREDEPLYESRDYSDPLQLEFSPPIPHDSPDPVDRTYLFCAFFDNGSTDESPPVKRQSTSPPVPDLGLGEQVQELVAPALGGPCGEETVRCLGGDNEGELCHNDDSVCAPGGGICDACPVHGGVTTMDEMFILLGGYYVAAPEPSQALLALAAVAALSALGGRRRRRSQPDASP